MELLTIKMLRLLHQELTPLFPLPLEQLLQRLGERGGLSHGGGRCCGDTAVAGDGRGRTGGRLGEREGVGVC